MIIELGKKYKVRKDLKGGLLGPIYVLNAMADMGGVELTVKEFHPNGFKVEENSWTWTDRMVEVDELFSMLKVNITDKTDPKKPELYEYHEYVRTLEYNKGVFWDMVNRYLGDSAFDRFEIQVSLVDNGANFFREVTYTRRN